MFILWKQGCLLSAKAKQIFGKAKDISFKKMMDIAATSLSEDDLLVYKERMAERLRRQIKQQGIEFGSKKNRLRKTIQALESEVTYAPLHEAYDGIENDDGSITVPDISIDTDGNGQGDVDIGDVVVKPDTDASTNTTFVGLDINAVTGQN